MTEVKYSTHTYDLSLKRVDVPIDLGGGSISVIAIKGDCFIKLNDKSQDPINLLYASNIKTTFTKFYLSNNVQVGGYVAIVIGKSCEFELTTNIARATHEPLLLPPQNIPEHLKDRAIDTPEIINIWDIKNAKFRHSFNVSPQTTNLRGVSFSVDGKKMYIIGRVLTPTVSGKIFEYDLSIAWDISTAVFRHSKDITAQTTSPFNLFFNPTGTLMYTLNRDINNILKYTLAESWNIATATFTTALEAPTINTIDLHIDSSGHKMYLVNSLTALLNEYDLSIAWDISTAVLKHSIDITPQTTWLSNIFLSPDGLKAYIVSFHPTKILEYRLLKAWDITTAVFEKSFNFNETLTAPLGLYLNPDGQKMYMGSENTNHIYEFDL